MLIVWSKHVISSTDRRFLGYNITYTKMTRMLLIQSNFANYNKSLSWIQYYIEYSDPDADIIVEPCYLEQGYVVSQNTIVHRLRWSGYRFYRLTSFIANSHKSFYCIPYDIVRVDPDDDAKIEPRDIELQQVVTLDTILPKLKWPRCWYYSLTWLSRTTINCYLGYYNT